MKDIVLETKNYDLHILKTKKFNKTVIAFRFISSFNEKNALAREFLLFYMLRGNKDYPSIRQMVIKEEEMYDSFLDFNIKREGNILISTIYVNFINERFVDENLSELALQLLLDTLNKPLLNSDFNVINFEYVYRNIKNSLDKIKENPRAYAFNKFDEIFNKDSILESSIKNTMENLNNLDKLSLVKSYEKMIKEKLIIYVIGDVDVKKIKRLIRDKVKIGINKKISFKNFEWPIIKKRVLVKKECFDIFNAYLIVGYKIDKLSHYMKEYVGRVVEALLVYNLNGLLFKRVREEENLAYNVGGYYSINSAKFIFYMEINKDNFKKGSKLIDECLDKLIKGNISDLDLYNAKEQIFKQLKLREDDLNGIMEYNFVRYYYKEDDIKTCKKMIEKVSVKDIKSFVLNMKKQLVYLLYEGCKDEKK